MRTIRSMASTSTRSGSVASGSRSTTFLPPMESIPDLSDFQSLSGSSAGSLSRQPSLRSRAVDDGAISNQTIVYPGDPRVIAPSRSSSLRRTTSMTDLGEEFESALRRAKDARPGLGFGLALIEGSPVTVSSGPTLRRDVIVTPPPSARGGGSRARPTNPESLTSVSDDAFFTSGARTSGEPSTSHSASSSLTDTHFRTRGTESSSAAPTEETSGSGTVIPRTYLGEGTSYLGISTDARRSAFTSESPSRATGLTRSRAIKARRDAASSLSYSSSNLSGAESFSGGDNGSGHTHSRSYSEYSRGDGFSTLESYSRSSYSRSANDTPLPSSSSEHSPESEEDPITTTTPTSTTQYETARSPSIMSFASLPSIPSLYETAELCPTDSEVTKSVSSEDFVTAKASAKAESVSDYITAPICDSEPPSPYTTAEICPTEVSTEYDDAECHCKPEKSVVSEGTQVTPPEPVRGVIHIVAPHPIEPVEAPVQIVAQPIDEEVQAIPEPVEEPVTFAPPALVEEAVQVTPPQPTEVIEVVPQPAVEEIQIPVPEPVATPRVRSPETYPQPPVIMIDPGFSLYPSDDVSTVSSASDIGSIPTVSSRVSRVSARNISLPESLSSPSLLASELPSERPTVEPLRPMTSTRSISSIPSSLPGPSPIGRPESLPTTTLLSSVTESTPSTISSRRPVSPRALSSPSVSISGSHWAPETDDTYESSILRASPSVQSIAFPEGPDISFDTSFLRPTASAYTSQEPSRLSTIDESQSSESPPITYSSPSSPSLTPTVSMSVSASAGPSPSPTGTVSISVSASATPSLSPSAPPTVPSPSLRAPSSTTVSSPILTPERSQVALTRTPSSVSTASSISLGSDILDNRSLFEEPIFEDVSTEPSLLSTHRTTVSRPISPANIPLPRTPSLLSTPTASASVSMSSPHGSTPSAYSDLLTIPSEVAPSERAPSERARSERPPSEGPSVIITDDINRLLQYLHGVENDRQRDNQGVHDHLGEIQNELRNLADCIEKEVPQVVPPPPIHLKDRSIGGSSVVSYGGPRGAPDYPSIPPTVTGKASPRIIAIPLTPPPHSPRSPSSLSSSISFLSSHHSDDFSLMGSEPLESEPLETELFETEPDVPRESSSSISSSPISYSPPSSSVPSSPSSSPSSEMLPLTPVTRSPPSSGEYLSRTSSDMTQRVTRTPSVSTPSVSPTPSAVSSATVRAVPTTPGIDREVINRIRDVLDAVKGQTDALWDGQLSTNHVLDELRQRVPRTQDNTELVERLQRLEDLINRLADAQARARALSPQPESLFDSGSDTSTAIRRLRERWDRMRRETPTLIAPTPMRPRTSLDDMMAELLRPPQPTAAVQIQPPPTFVPLNFRPDARGPRPRSASPTLLGDLPPLRPFTVPIPEPLITRDIGRRRPSRPTVAPRPSALAPRQFTPLQPSRRSPETPITQQGIPRRQPAGDVGPDFLQGVHRLRGQRPSAAPDGWIHSRPEPEGEPVVPQTVVQPDAGAEPGRATAPPELESRPWYQAAPPRPPLGPVGPGVIPQVQPGQPGGIPPIPPPFTQSVILPPIFNDMMAMVRENRFMHLASLEQQRELMRYMNSLNDWLGHDVEDRQAELRGVSARIDQLHDDMNRLGLSRGPVCKVALHCRHNTALISS
ncbi:hypothetical protein EDB89DRAFT_1479631 [Lactarius sanguifluus]|nr:hypothetical protein EDB89DRAFT_1479631 [Lactarius sanguifluus]